MTDYTFDNYVGREQMASQLANNEEQFLYVVTGATKYVDLKSAMLFDIADWVATPEDRAKVADRLREIADRVENG